MISKANCVLGRTYRHKMYSLNDQSQKKFRIRNVNPSNARCRQLRNSIPKAGACLLRKETYSFCLLSPEGGWWQWVGNGDPPLVVNSEGTYHPSSVPG
jgi:hypothetical protein